MYCFAKICRLCLSHDSALIHCRARDKNNIPNYHKIKILFPPLVNKTSQHFPIWICSKCQEQVNQSYEFKQKCYKTYKLLKKYSFQLFEANKVNSIPDVPTTIFQEVKPIVDHNVISIDEEDHSENYYNADDITIVKNELLPSNLKNEPEFHNLIQEIIDKNIEAIKQIHETDISTTLKRELINISESNLSNINNERVVQEDEVQQDEAQQSPHMSSSIAPVDNNDFLQPNNLITCATDTVNESSTNNSLDATAFTLDYTNTSFETFASYVAPSLTRASEPAAKTNGTITGESAAENPSNSFTRVLRQRKSICYRTMQNCLVALDNKRNDNRKKIKPPSVKKSNKSQFAVKQIPEQKETDGNGSIINENLVGTKNRKPQEASITRVSHSIETMRNEQKQKHGAYICDKCSKQYVLYFRFRVHINQCNGIIKHQCSVCQKVFARYAELRYHSKIHKIFKTMASCDLCHKQYSTKYSVRRHVQKHHRLNVTKTNQLL